MIVRQLLPGIESLLESRILLVIRARIDQGGDNGSSLSARMHVIGPPLALITLAIQGVLGGDDEIRMSSINLRSPTLGNVRTWGVRLSSAVDPSWPDNTHFVGLNLQLDFGIREQKVTSLGTDLVIFQTLSTSIDDIQGRLLVGIVAFLPVAVIVFHWRVDSI